MKKERIKQTEDSSGVHLWLVFMKAFQALFPHAASSIKRTELGDSDFRILEALLMHTSEHSVARSVRLRARAEKAFLDGPKRGRCCRIER